MEDTDETAIPTFYVNERKEQFVIDSDSSADWYLGKLADLETRKARVKYQAKRMAEQIDSDINALKYKFEEQLKEYCRQRTANSRRKSVSFFNGTASFRTVPAGLKIEDEDAFIQYALLSPKLESCVVQKLVLDKRQANNYVKKLAEETGELCPGVVPVPSRESFSVSFGGDEEDESGSDPVY